MELDFIAIRSAADTDGQMAPAPGSVAGGIAHEPADGPNVQYAVATALRVDVERNGKRENMLKVSDIRATIFITDSRIAFAVGNYDKGGGWVGTSAWVLVFNAASRARANLRSRGLTLTGQVRYAWLEAIGGSQQYGTLDSERLLVVTKAVAGGSSHRIYVDFTLPKDVSSTAVAAETARRAARFRLAAGEAALDPDAKVPLEELAQASTLMSQKGSFALHEFPGCWAASPSSVDLAGLIARQLSGSGDGAPPAPPSPEQAAASLPGAPSTPPSEAVAGSKPVPPTQASSAAAAGSKPVPPTQASSAAAAAPDLLHTNEHHQANPAPAPVPPESSAQDVTWTAVLDDGQEIALRDLTLFGRDPAAAPEDLAQHGPDGVRLHPLADDSMTLSKTHLGVVVDAAGLLVTDRHSTNGSTTSTPTGQRPLAPGVARRLHDGDTVTLGGRSFLVKAGAGSPAAARDDAEAGLTIDRSQLPPPPPWKVRLDDGEQFELRTLNAFGRAPTAQPEEYRAYGYAHVKLVPVSGDVSMADNHAVILLQDGRPILENRSRSSVTITSGAGEQRLGAGERVALADGDTLRLGGRTLQVVRAAPFGQRAAPPSGGQARASGTTPSAGSPEPQPFAPQSTSQANWKRPALIGAAVVVVLLIIGNVILSNRATTLEQVCSDYTNVWIEANNPSNAIYANSLFDAVGDLAHSAGHYGGGGYDFSADAAALQSIADSSVTDDYAIARASQSIARACGD